MCVLLLCGEVEGTWGRGALPCPTRFNCFRKAVWLLHLRSLALHDAQIQLQREKAEKLSAREAQGVCVPEYSRILRTQRVLVLLQQPGGGGGGCTTAAATGSGRSGGLRPAAPLGSNTAGPPCHFWDS